MLQEQLDMIKGLDGIKEITIPDNFVYQTSKVKPAQIGNMCFANEKFRKIRMTYFDAGDNVQVYITYDKGYHDANCVFILLNVHSLS